MSVGTRLDADWLTTRLRKVRQGDKPTEDRVIAGPAAKTQRNSENYVSRGDFWQKCRFARRFRKNAVSRGVARSLYKPCL